MALANTFLFSSSACTKTPKAFGAPALIAATVAFGWQIFFRFSGTRTWRAASPRDGVQPDSEFQQSLPATGLGEFWRAAHQPLELVRDYVYIPLAETALGR